MTSAEKNLLFCTEIKVSAPLTSLPERICPSIPSSRIVEGTKRARRFPTRFPTSPKALYRKHWVVNP